VVSPEVYLSSLAPETSYVVRVSAMTGAGEGPASPPLLFHTWRSDIYAVMDNIYPITEQKRAEDCLPLSVLWNETLCHSVSNIPSLLGLTDATDWYTGAVNYTLVILDPPQQERWRARLDPFALSYKIPPSKQLVVSVHLDLLLLNGSHLHLSSRVNLSSPDCAGAGGNSRLIGWQQRECL
jgi:hypothetical protein